MGLMDKVKAQASTLAQSANAGIAKLDSMPAQRRADALLRSLGLAVLAERTGRATAETPGQIDQLLAELGQHEAQNNVDLVRDAAQAQAQQMQAQQARMQMQGDYLTSSPPADPNVPASGAPGQGGGWPQGGQGGFPGQGGQGGFPGQGGQGGFPGQGGQGGFPGQGGQGGFPAEGGFAGQGGTPGAAPAGFPGAAPTSFPETSPATAFPAANPIGFPGTSDEPEPGTGQSFFPPASGV